MSEDESDVISEPHPAPETTRAAAFTRPHPAISNIRIENGFCENIKHVQKKNFVLYFGGFGGLNGLSALCAGWLGTRLKDRGHKECRTLVGGCQNV